MNFNRRSLLKALGLTAAGSILPGCERDVHELIPYLLPDEEIVPGVANWYASTCRECEAGCGVIVKVMEGRAKKIEGNARHPVNRGKLCAAGQAALQGLYNPDRIRGPLRRTGNRGDGEFEPVSWNDGLSLWVEQIHKHQGGSAMISRPVTGTLADLFMSFMQDVGGSVLFYDPSGAPSVLTAMKTSFGTETLPHFDLAHCDYLLSFGAPFLEHWLSPVSFGVEYGRMRQGLPGMRGRFVQIEPRLSLTAASADRWLPIKPGTEGLLAVGIAREILTQGGSTLSAAARKDFDQACDGLSLERIAILTDISIDEIRRLAREFSAAGAPLAIGGGPASAHAWGTDALTAINALNAIVGRIGKPGGLQFFQQTDLPGAVSVPRRVGEQALLNLADDVDTGGTTLLHLYHTNPVFTMPDATHIDRLFIKVPFTVSFSSFMDESTLMADLILPDHTPLETWDDHVQHGITRGPAVGLAQPVVTPLYDTRATGDVFLDASNRLGGKISKRLPWADFKEMLQSRWRTFLKQEEPSTPFEDAWVARLQAGGCWREETKPLSIRTKPPAPCALPSFIGDEKQFPFYFSLFASTAQHDGRGANRPWLQQLPDTLTTAAWGSWVELNPKTARDLGLRQGDIARVTSLFGSLEAPVVYFPGIRPDVVAMPIGQGHTAYGRYAKGIGVNPLSLLAPVMDRQSGCLATGDTRVRVERVRSGSTLVVLDSGGQDPLRQHIQQKGGL